MVRRYFARVHDLPKPWSDIMGRKKWATISEEMLHRGSAAVVFLREYHLQGMGSNNIRLSEGRFSKFGVEQQFLQLQDEDGHEIYLGFCLGNAAWACLMWPVLQYVDPSNDFVGYYLDPQGAAEWTFILDPFIWKVVMTRATVYEDKVFMVKTGASEPLLKFFFADVARHKLLNVKDLQMLCDFMNIDTAKLKRPDLIDKIVNEVGGDDAEYIAKIKADMQKPEKTKIIGDALDEMVLGELPGEDQSDFQMVAKEVESKGKADWAIFQSDWKNMHKKKKASAKAKAKARAKAKAMSRKNRFNHRARRKERKLDQKDAGNVQFYQYLLLDVVFFI